MAYVDSELHQDQRSQKKVIQLRRRLRGGHPPNPGQDDHGNEKRQQEAWAQPSQGVDVRLVVGREFITALENDLLSRACAVQTRASACN